MRYTLDNGVETIDESQRKLLVSIPVIAGLLLLFGIAGRHGGGPAPVAVGKPHLIAVKTLDSSTSGIDTTSSSQSGGQGGAGAETSLAASGSNLQSASGGVGGGFGGSASTAPAPSPPPTGGMGGGSPTGTIMCDNTGGALPITCTACTPSIVVAAGQKAVISTSPACALVN